MRQGRTTLFDTGAEGCAARDINQQAFGFVAQGVGMKPRKPFLFVFIVLLFTGSASNQTFAGGPVCPPTGYGPVMTCPPPPCAPIPVPVYPPRWVPPSCSPPARDNSLANIVEGTGRFVAGVVAFPFKVVHALVSDRNRCKSLDRPICAPPNCCPPPSMMPPPFVLGPPPMGPVGYARPPMHMVPYQGH